MLQVSFQFLGWGGRPGILAWAFLAGDGRLSWLLDTPGLGGILLGPVKATSFSLCDVCGYPSGP